MSTINTALHAYGNAHRAVEQSIEDNNTIRAHQSIVGLAIDAEARLRDEAYTVFIEGDKKPFDYIDAGVFISVKPETQTYADIEAIDALIAQGLIPATLRAQIVKTQERPPRISIKHI